MTDFSHLNSLAVGGKTADMVLYRLEGQPTLVVRSAMQDNKEYVNAALKKSSRLVRRVRQGDMTAEMITQDRVIARELYAKYVIVGWKGIKDAKGKIVKFSANVCLEFLTALPNYVFDEIREFANNPSNFLNEDDNIDVESSVKN